MKKLLIVIATIAFATIISCNDPDIGERDVKKKVRESNDESIKKDSVPAIKGMRVDL